MKDVSSSKKKHLLYDEYSTFLAKTEMSCALQISVIYLHFLWPLGIISESAFLPTFPCEDKPSSEVFLARDEITVKVVDHSYLNSWIKILPAGRCEPQR